ncbi:hypothetical protein C3942_01320 [Solimonas fluminis]|uniref:YCII-related domain-containing protein n=1 Tax=Solimonas fluminis TaxID=2086571 RepID=A0A2S5TKU2_9GAMM|nr:YciI family protein [Solimonas fluminis]PPE75562.1 hypothetical protein C3942_01320 [Solimonas fluminis]
MKKFLCLGYYDVEKFAALSPEAMEALVSQCPPRDADLRATGRMIFAASLSGLHERVCLRPRNGKPVVTDGPYAEAKEMVGGLFMIEAEDITEAIAIASRHPAAELGEDVGWGIEILPFEYYISGQDA